MNISALLGIAIIIFSGLLFGKLISFLNLPHVTGYLIGGLIIGPSVLSILSADMVASLGMISQVALGFIAFTIGMSFKVEYFKRLGWTPMVIGFFEATLAVLFVQIALLLAGFELSFALVLGSIAAATAPAATVMVIKQYKAKGPTTDTLLSVVAVDDAIALILFGFAAAISQILTGDSQSTSLFMSILTPVLDILFALLLGAVIGFVMKFILPQLTSRGGRLSVLIGVVLLITGLANQFGLSELLANMAGGMVLTNASLDAQRLDEMTDYITPPLYMMFFVLSGARLQLGIIPSVGLAGILYIVFRVAGKLSGAYLGARIMKAPENVRKYLGPMLIPQAGVAIGLTTLAETLVPNHAAEITAIVLVGTLVYELVGPIVTKMALQKAGEITVKGK